VVAEDVRGLAPVLMGRWGGPTGRPQRCAGSVHAHKNTVAGWPDRRWGVPPLSGVGIMGPGSGPIRERLRRAQSLYAGGDASSTGSLRHHSSS
jgi:hypothetical protein